MATSTKTLPVDDPSLPLSTADVKQQVRIRMGKEGLAARPTETVFQVFNATVERIPNAPALHQKRPKSVRAITTGLWNHSVFGG